MKIIETRNGFNVVSYKTNYGTVAKVGAVPVSSKGIAGVKHVQTLSSELSEAEAVEMVLAELGEGEKPKEEPKKRKKKTQETENE